MIEVACKNCDHVGEADIVEGKPPHGSELRCPKCKKHIRYLPKTENGKKRRPNAHRELVAKYGRGFCESCLRRKEELTRFETLVAHHVIEFKDGGSEARENVWILCTACHDLVHKVRTYCGRSVIDVPLPGGE